MKAIFTPQRSHWPIRVDLRSDTVTRPTEAMRRAICDAPVGDEQLGEDPSVNQLVETVAELLGKPAAVFLPSGTMCNEIALALHCRPGDEFYCDRTAHPLHAEAGGPAVLAGGSPGHRWQAGYLHGGRVGRRVVPAVQVRTGGPARVGGTDGEPGGGYHLAGRRHRGCDGRSQAEPPVEPPRWGARFNATVVTGERPSAVAASFDSVWIDFSKGLGAPVGAASAGDEDFIDGAWRWKQRLGGSMRQAGVLAAAASYALAHHVDRLAGDHVAPGGWPTPSAKWMGSSWTRPKWKQTSSFSA